MMSKLPKISIIGDGRVGSAIAFSLLLKGLAKEMVLVDYNSDVAVGDALDLSHATTFANSVNIYSGDYADTKDSDIVVISSSVPCKDLTSRLDFSQGNTDHFKEMIPKIVKASPNAILLVISNPLDIMTYVALKISGFPSSRVIGTGTLIDTGRFRSLLAKEVKINPEDIHVYILGEHGDSQFPLLSCGEIGGIPFDRTSPKIKEICEQTRLWAYHIIQKKGNAYPESLCSGFGFA
jgi:L-lactate dehydrogenase